MTKVVSTHKARHKVFAIVMAMMLTILCILNVSTLTVSAATDVPKRTAPVLTSFDRNYLNYFNTINKKVAVDPSIDTPLEAIETYLKISNISYYKLSGDNWDFKLQFRDFSCSIKSGTSSKGASITLIDKVGFEAVVVSRSGNQAKIQSNDGPVQPWTKNLTVSSKDTKAKTFTLKNGSRIMQSTDVAMIITTIGGFYGSKTSVAGYNSGIQSNADFAVYLANYLESHSEEARDIRNYLISLSTANGQTLKDSEIACLYPSGQPNSTIGSGSSNCRKTWDVSSFMHVNPYLSDIRDVYVGVYLWPADGDNGILVSIKDGYRIEFRCGENLDLVKTITWDRPSTTHSVDLIYADGFGGEVVGETNTNVLTLWIMLDSALYEFAHTEGLL